MIPPFGCTRPSNSFSLNQIPKDQKFNLASFHLVCEVVQWYQWFEKENGTLYQGEFTQNILVIFGPSSFEDFTNALTKLHQTTIVREYQKKFEKLANHIEELDDSFYRSYFISGLKEEIQVEVKMFNSNNMIAKIGLAKLVEDKFNIESK